MREDRKADPSMKKKLKINGCKPVYFHKFEVKKTKKKGKKKQAQNTPTMDQNWNKESSVKRSKNKDGSMKSR